MKTIHPLSIFCTMLLMAGLAISCNKNKNTSPAKEKNPIEYIPQMAGKHKMVGTYREAHPLASPPKVIIENVEIFYDISILSDSVISIKTSEGSEFTGKYYFSASDTADARFGLSISPRSYMYESLYYYFLKDSLAYHSYYNNYFVQETTLHSE